MAERSFKKEVQKLKAGAGEEFHGEGILAVTKALLQSGVSYVGGYQGAPISHLMDVLSDAQDILADLGVHFESSASEAAAAAMLAASVNYPLRGAVTWKSTVGTNVASDALANLASGGVKGGALIVIGEDYGEGSSIMQERTHAFAMKSQIWLLDPRPNLPSIVDAVEKGFELSEASNTPVMLELRIRACHVHGRFVAKDNVRPRLPLKTAMENPRRDISRIVLPPASFIHEHEKINERWPAAVEFIKEHNLNEFFEGSDDSIGIIVLGGLYNTLIRAMDLLGLADAYGNSKIPLYVMNVAYPLVDDEIKSFCQGKDAVLVVEEGQPDYIEQAIHTILRKADIQTPVAGKGVLPVAGEYTGLVIKQGLEQFLSKWGSTQLTDDAQPEKLVVKLPDAGAIAGKVPPRPPSFCTGCPERPVFTAMKLLQEEMGEFHVSADIGCHLFSINPPFHIGNTTMGYGLGGAASSAFNAKAEKRVISVMGDGGFWHNGLTSGIGNAVFNQSNNLTVVVDNNYSAATGGQDVLSSRAENPTRSTFNPIEKAVKGVGVKWARTVRTYDLKETMAAMREALTSDEQGPKVIVAQSECMLNRQRREKPLIARQMADGKRVVKERFGVDADTCTGDHACIRLSGCPSLSIKNNPDPLKVDPVTAIDNSCVGCGHCGEVAHTAILCPSFYKAKLVHNPSGWERFRYRMRRRFIQFLQRRADRRRLKHAF